MFYEFKEILVEINFIEELKAIEVTKSCPPFFHNSPYLRKYVLIRLTSYRWQPYISQFGDITKGLL